MSIDDVYNKYKGQSLLVPGADASDAGQCVMAADYFIHEAYGLPYVWLNAIDFWRNPDANLKANFDFILYSPVMPIKQGDFVIYGSGVGSPYGHISTAAQAGVGNSYIGYDSNWGHNLTLHMVNHNDSYNQYILGILRLKGVTMQSASKDEVNAVYIACCNRSAQPSEITNYTQHPFETCFLEVYNSQEAINWRAKANAAVSAPGNYVQVGTLNNQPIYTKN